MACDRDWLNILVRTPENWCTDLKYFPKYSVLSWGLPGVHCCQRSSHLMFLDGEWGFGVGGGRRGQGREGPARLKAEKETVKFLFQGSVYNLVEWL